MIAINAYDGAAIKRDTFNLFNTATVIPAAKKAKTITNNIGEK